jgi:hypothetical protein
MPVLSMKKPAHVVWCRLFLLFSPFIKDFCADPFESSGRGAENKDRP